MTSGTVLFQEKSGIQQVQSVYSSMIHVKCPMTVLSESTLSNKKCESAVNEAVSLCKQCTLLMKAKNARAKPINLGSSAKTRMETIKMYGTVPSFKKYLTIGIPTVSRKKENYLHQTLQSVIDSMDDAEKRNVTILVLYVDTDGDVRKKRAKETAYKFASSIKSGLLLLYQILPEFYPEENATRRTFNDSVERIKWRSKQVLDFAVLLMYSQNISEYFLILEDDVVTTPHFVMSIKKFVQEKGDSDWVSLTFSSFFIIGRLFKNQDLNKLREFLILFHLEKPVDLLIMQFLDLLVPSKTIVTRRIPGLFQHIGLFSSLEGKVQKAKDRSFTGASRVYHFNNPPADIVTTLGVYRKHYPELCYYDSNKYFWGSAPKRNDTFDVILREPVKVKRIFISSGLATHKDDIIKYAELRVAPVFDKMITDKKASCSNFYTVAYFEKGKVDISSNGTFKSEIQSLQAAIEEDNSLTCGKQCNVSDEAMRIHLHRLGKTYKPSKWVPHMLLEIDKKNKWSLVTSEANMGVDNADNIDTTPVYTVSQICVEENASLGSSKIHVRSVSNCKKSITVQIKTGPKATSFISAIHLTI
ncbi:alpha-1,3-mannosyl-glycoprotein 4-beta-N-acetylglucosaminyltransferase C-like [Argiope bruennichi]|uniref:alpha-1,3-mannosyl-glycoprotein 4-beta-N-acetylglucosaminyltransferase C-like n=1 Tax=Argiope bruennichi TaxID=94029 RepID=UPI0024952B4F|nr:alpha-1,3-mannosyl-glycoprotein 4-beta-N-acetylglucosaminyltransferase C-like [Argiope bruennichi]